MWLHSASDIYNTDRRAITTIALTIVKRVKIRRILRHNVQALHK